MKRTFPFTLSISTILIAVSCLVAGIAEIVPVDSAAAPSLVLHASRKTGTGHSCSPGVTSCADAATTANWNPDGGAGYNVYLVVTGYDRSAGVHEINVGINSEMVTGTGVDVYSWTLCADSDSASTDWLQTGGSNRIRWSAINEDTLTVAGYFYVTAYSPASLALIPPGGLEATFTAFSGQPQFLPKSALGYIGFGLDGCNPCLASCNFTPVQSSTWSSLKLLFHSP